MLTNNLPRDSAEHDLEDRGNLTDFFESIEHYVTWRIAGALYSRGLDTPASDPGFAAEYWIERAKLNLERVLKVHVDTGD